MQVAICAGFFCDGNVWDAIEAHTKKMAHLAAKTATLGMAGDILDVEKTGVAVNGEVTLAPSDMAVKDIVFGTIKNIWLMFVNAFVLLFFHYWLTFSVLYYLYIHPYETDPFPHDGKCRCHHTWSSERSILDFEMAV